MKSSGFMRNSLANIHPDSPYFPFPLNRDLKKPLRLAKSLLQLQMTSPLLLLSKNGSAVPIMQVLLLLFQLNVIITYYIAQLSRKREMMFSVAKKICQNPI